ncbi:MAG TPA: RdgB/HAM1 family non-canonical purine NTP pyrophosphatase [Planctomycetota bacterium]|nr:RdgB/HAM1 family non-canonical purine NTP pyrophosphatase [Planctomycetota bacterium]
MTRLLVATTNRGKLAELQPALGALGWELCGLQEFPGVPVAREDGYSFAENARDKALHYARATGLAALADDSGLCVDALGGAPGIHSARYAGSAANDAQNRSRLLAELRGHENRRASFACSLCLAEPVAGGDGRLSLTEVEGRCAGQVLDAERGTGGFGYDPLFVPDDPAAAGRSFAELPRADKQRLSHRGAALALLLQQLAARAAGGPRAIEPGAAR